MPKNENESVYFQISKFIKKSRFHNISWKFWFIKSMSFQIYSKSLPWRFLGTDHFPGISQPNNKVLKCKDQ